MSASPRTSTVAAWWPRDFVMVHGPDAATYLQGQLSQDVAALAVGASTWSLLLQPQGKVDALVRVLRSGDAAFVLDVDAGWGEAVVARLGRFKLRTKADIEPVAWRCLAVRGPDAHALARPSGGDVAVVADWPGLPGVDLVGPAPQVPAGVTEVDQAVLEAARVETGWPAMGAELTPDTIPAEAGVVGISVSFTKGCYTGQELVARIDSRGGNVPRHVRGLRSPVPLVVGAELHDAAGAVVGVVTSSAVSDTLGPVGLGSVHRSVTPPATLADDVQVLELPLVAG